MTNTADKNNAIPFFQTTPNVAKPYALMDLDDTLFQTQRKIDAWGLCSDIATGKTSQLVCATVNKQGETLSLMTQRQQVFLNWLFASTDLIAVTARDTQEIKRVKLPFNSWQVLTHGAVIVQPNGDVLAEWQTKMFAILQPLQHKIKNLIAIVKDYNQAHGDLLKLTPHSDTFQSIGNNPVSHGLADANRAPQKLTIYLAVKHKQKDHQALQQVADWLVRQYPHLIDDFYIHINANNLAILPHCIHKKHAVAFLLEHYLDADRPCFGFGDSLADLPFLQLLDWYGMPNHGQLHDKVSSI